MGPRRVTASVLAALAIAGALFIAPPAVALVDGDETGAPLDLAAAQLRQEGPQLVLALQTHRPWRNSTLAGPRSPYLCLQLSAHKGEPPATQLCLRATTRGRLRIVRYALPDGRVLRVGRLDARITRHDARSVKARFPADAARIAGRALRWRVVSGPDRQSCPALPAQRRECADRVPDDEAALLKVRRVRRVGCRRHGASYRSHGSRRRRAIALTFDDGPSRYTDDVLRILRRFKARATFFVLGNRLGGRGALLRRMLREGHDLGNHTFNHANLSGGGPGAYAQLRRTSARIRAATRFRPCLFRAPYGAVGALTGVARSLGMTTIEWDVDPRDWSRPGTGAIYGRVVSGGRAGSIVVMHDGGGPRDQTVTALPGILRTLRRRGYRFVTVSELLGLAPIYR